jgi:hypothetical protein
MDGALTRPAAKIKGKSRARSPLHRHRGRGRGKGRIDSSFVHNMQTFDNIVDVVNLSASVSAQSSKTSRAQPHFLERSEIEHTPRNQNVCFVANPSLRSINFATVKLSHDKVVTAERVKLNSFSRRCVRVLAIVLVVVVLA